MSRIQIIGQPGVGKTAVAADAAAALQLPLVGLGLVFRGMAALQMPRERLLTALASLTIRPADPRRRQPQRLLLDGAEVNCDERDLKAEAMAMRLSRDPTVTSTLMRRIDSQLPGTCILEGRFAAGLLRPHDRVIQLTASLQTRSARLDKESARLSQGDTETWLAGREWTDAADRKLELLEQGIWHCVVTDHSSRSETTDAVTAIIRRAVDRTRLRLTCVMPARDEEANIGTLLNELDRQRRNDDVDTELIVVDDGSHDTTGQVAAEHHAEVITLPHSGRAAARNHGVERADGDVVVYLDADTLPQPGFLSRARLFHEVYPNAVVLGPRRHVTPGVPSEPRPKKRLDDSREVILDRYGYDLHQVPHTWLLAYTCNLSVQRDTAHRFRFDTGFTGWGIEDVELAYRIQTMSRTSLWAFDANRRVLHKRRAGADAHALLSQWRNNLATAERLHGSTAMLPLGQMEAVLDPDVHADLLEVCRQIHGEPRAEVAARLPRKMLGHAAAMQDGRPGSILPSHEGRYP